MKQGKVEEMRQNIFAMKDTYLTDEAFCRRLKTKMGI